MTLPDFIAQEGAPDVVKVDIEGGELRLDVEALSRARQVFLEVHVPAFSAAGADPDDYLAGVAAGRPRRAPRGRRRTNYNVRIGSGEHALVERAQPLGDAPAVVALAAPAAVALALATAPLGVGGERGERVRERVGVVRADELLGVADDLVERAGVAGQHRQAARPSPRRPRSRTAPATSRAARSRARSTSLSRCSAGSSSYGTRPEHPQRHAELAPPSPPARAPQRTAADERQLGHDAAPAAQQPQRDDEVLDALLADQPRHAEDAQRAPGRGARAARARSARRRRPSAARRCARRHPGELQMQPRVAR